MLGKRSIEFKWERDLLILDLFVCFLYGALYLLSLNFPLAMRLTESDDQDFLNALYVDSRADLQQLPLAPTALQQMISMQQMSQAMGIRTTYPNAQYWLLLWNKEAVGRLIMDKSDKETRLIDIAVISAWRKKGIATQVIWALQDYAVQVQVPISLAVRCDNVDAQAIYRKAGFIVSSTDTLFDQMNWHPSFRSAVTK
jgi:ribosomal protein S18 acetylase RimI-like enzyme